MDGENNKLVDSIQPSRATGSEDFKVALMSLFTFVTLKKMSSERKKRLIEEVMILAKELSKCEFSMEILKLKDILRQSIESECSRQICQVIWDCNLFAFLINTIKRDFMTLPGSWYIGLAISNIICEFVKNFTVENESILNVYSQQLQCAADRILSAVKSYQNHIMDKDLLANEKKLLYSLLGNIIIITEKHPNLISYIFHSDDFFNLFISDNKEISMAVLLLASKLLGTERPDMKVGVDNLDRYLSQMVYRLSFSTDIDLARLTVETILTWLILHPDLIPSITSEFDLICILNKWYGKDFDESLIRIKRTIKSSNNEERLNTQKFENSAVIIQRAYRKYKHHKNCFKQQTNSTKGNGHGLLEAALDKDIQRKKLFRKLHYKHIQEIQNIPAGQVNEYLKQKQNDAALKIQAAWRGYICRKKNKDIYQQARENKAAIFLQREVRKWQKRQNKMNSVEEFDNLNWNSIETLQLLAEKRKEKPVTLPTSQEECKEQFEEAKRLLEEFYKHHNSRLYRAHNVDTLLRKIDIHTTLFSNLPSLNEVTKEDANMFLAQSLSVIPKAKLAHENKLKKLKYPWWKQLIDEDELNELAIFSPT